MSVRDGPLDEVDERLRGRIRSVEASSPGFSLAHAVLDALVDRHAPVMVRAAAEELEGLITLRRDLLAFHRLAVSQQEKHLSDVADNQGEAIDMADATRDYVEGATEAYRLRRDERNEAGIRRLTVLAGILGPMTLLTAIYGSNFANIPGTHEPWGSWIFVFLAVWHLSRRGLL